MCNSQLKILRFKQKSSKSKVVLEFTDEYGNRYTVKKFLQKLGIKDFNNGFYFPTNVKMTKNLQFTTQKGSDKCMCICKSIDIPIWQG